MTDDDSAPAPDKAPDAFRTISEVAEELDLPQHVLRFWETRFGQIRPMKRGGGRRYYRPQDVELLRGIRALLYSEGYTIKGVQRILKEQGPRSVIAAGRPEGEAPEAGPAQGAPTPTAPEIAAHAAPQTGPVQAVAPAVAPAPPRPAARTLPAGEAIPAVRRPAAPPRAEVAASERERDLPARPAGLGAAARRTLQATLAELLECKRLLDQAR